MAELDWRERPMMSPLGGFLIQSRAGDSGNFEVVIAWPDGGLAHFWRDNDDDAFAWHGPTLFGSGDYIGATLIESDNRFIEDTRLGNFEVLATRLDGTVDHYWRDNSPHFSWNGPFELFVHAVGSPSMAYTGAMWHLEDSLSEHAHGPSHFYAVYPGVMGGFEFWRHDNDTIDDTWKDLGRERSIFNMLGVGLALTTMNGHLGVTGYKDLGRPGDIVAAGVSTLGRLLLSVNSRRGSIQPDPHNYSWIERTVFGRDLFPDLSGEFIGRPCLIQGDYGYEEVSDFGFSFGHYGNLELVVPSNRGGILHFWKDCGRLLRVKAIGKGWSGPTRIPGPLYDEVSLIQSNFSHGEHGNLEMVARQRRQRGFDFFWRDEGFTWHGPQRIGDVASVSQPLASSPNPSAFGQTVTITATVTETTTPSAGHVTFFDGDRELGRVPLASGTALLPVGDLPVGTRLLTGSYTSETAVGSVTSKITHYVEKPGIALDVIGVARRLQDASRRESHDGRDAEAAVEAQAAVEVLRGFQPPLDAKTEYWDLLANVLHDFVIRLFHAGRLSEMAGPAEEVLQVYQRLARARDANVIGIVDRVLSLSSTVATVQLLTEAVNAAQVAVNILREFDPEAQLQLQYTERLAEAWYTLALRLQTAGRIDVALPPAEEAVQLFQTLAEVDPARFGPILQKVESLIASLTHG